MTTTVDRKRDDLTPASLIRMKSAKPQKQSESESLTCGILAYQGADDTYDYYAEQANGCVYIYLLDPDNGSVVAGYPAQCQVGNKLQVERPYSIGCNCSQP